MKMSGLIKENPHLLLLLEHFEIDFVVSDKTIRQLCADYQIPEPLFLVFSNIYNGFEADIKDIVSVENIFFIIRFLKNSHSYYKTDKYPEIKGFIKDLQDRTGSREVKLIEKFFADYFSEVVEHLDYEDDVAFPYFVMLAEKNGDANDSRFSAKEYKDHHSDIETKLADLKNLLLKHIHVSNELSLRRKLFYSLFELEFDLHIHALIEDKILLPLIDRVERKLNE